MPDRSIKDETLTIARGQRQHQPIVYARMPSALVAIRLAIFLSVLLSVWVTGALWARSTWLKRHTSLHVRVRMPALVLADTVLDVLATTFICLEQILSYNHASMPCNLINGVSALGIVLSRGILFRRVVMLYMAFTTYRRVNGDGLQLAKLKRLGARVYTLWSIVGACAVVASILPFRLCSSTICQSKCTWSAQYLLLIPLCLVTDVCIYVAQWLLARTGSVDRVGIIEEIRRILMLNPFRTAAFAIVILMDKGILQIAEPWLTVNAVCWLAVYVANFATLHMVPSFTYGYAPTWPRSNGRVVPNTMGAFSVHPASLDAILAARVNTMLNVPGRRQRDLQSHEAKFKPLEQKELKPNLSGDAGKTEDGKYSPGVDLRIADEMVEGGPLGRKSARWDEAGMETNDSRSSDMAPWNTFHFSHVRGSSVDHGRMGNFRASDSNMERGQSGHYGDSGLGVDWGMDFELFDHSKMVLEDILSDQPLLEEFLSFCKSLLSEDLAYFLCLLRAMLLPQYQQAHPAASNQERDQFTTAPPSIDDLRLLYYTFLEQRSVHAVPLSRSLSKALHKNCKLLLKPISRQFRSSSVTAPTPFIQRLSFLGTNLRGSFWLSSSNLTPTADAMGESVMSPVGSSEPDGHGPQPMPADTQAQQQPRSSLHSAPTARWSRDLLHVSSGRRRSLAFLIARLFQPREPPSTPEPQDLGAPPPLVVHTIPQCHPEATKSSAEYLLDEQQEQLNEVTRLLWLAYREVELIILLQVLGPFAQYMASERREIERPSQSRVRPLRSVTLDHMGIPSDALARSSHGVAQHPDPLGRSGMDHYKDAYPGSGSSSPSQRSSSTEPSKMSDELKLTWQERLVGNWRRTSDSSHTSTSASDSTSTSKGQCAQLDGERNRTDFAAHYDV